MRNPIPLVTAHPSAVFRFVYRDDRAAYSRIMHRTMAVQFRDLNRVMRAFTIAIGRELLAPIKRLAALLTEAADDRWRTAAGRRFMAGVRESEAPPAWADGMGGVIRKIEAEAAHLGRGDLSLDVERLARALRRTAYADAGLFHELHPAATQTELEAYVDRAAAAIAAAYEKERAG